MYERVGAYKFGKRVLSSGLQVKTLETRFRV